MLLKKTTLSNRIECTPLLHKDNTLPCSRGRNNPPLYDRKIQTENMKIDEIHPERSKNCDNTNLIRFGITRVYLSYWLKKPILMNLIVNLKKRSKPSRKSFDISVAIANENSKWIGNEGFNKHTRIWKSEKFKNWGKTWTLITKTFASCKNKKTRWVLKQLLENENLITAKWWIAEMFDNWKILRYHRSDESIIPHTPWVHAYCP